MDDFSKHAFSKTKYAKKQGAESYEPKLCWWVWVIKDMNNKKDIKVELIRIIACFLVIVYHTRTLPLLEDGTVSETAVFIECICCICVVTFFMISGFFMYKEKNGILKDWLHVIKSYILKLFLPMLVVAAFCICFHDFLVSSKTFIECIKNIDIKYLFNNLIDGIKSFSADKWPGSAAHLWYVFAYGYIVIYYPITRLFLKLDKKIIYVVMCVLFVAQVFNDIIIYFDYWTFNTMFLFIPRPVIYSVWGYLFYNDIVSPIRKLEVDEKNKIIYDKKILILSIVMYALSFIFIFFMQYMYNVHIQGSHTYTAWYTGATISLSISVMLFVMNLNIDKLFNDKIKNAILNVGSMTLGIFLIHFLVVVKYNTLTFQRDAQVILGTNFFTQMVYVVFYNLAIFITSVVILLIIRWLMRCGCAGLLKIGCKTKKT